METALHKAIEQFPAILERNAPAMMRRMIARMKAQLENDDRAGGQVSHGLLFLRVGEDDLVREFLAATTSTFVKNEPSEFGGLSLEPEGGRPQLPEFQSSDVAFAKLCAEADRLRVFGTDGYGKEKFLDAMTDAFVRSRMDERATAELMPYAKSALNAELQALYSKLADLAK